jgi:hypothetical protein
MLGYNPYIRIGKAFGDKMRCEADRTKSLVWIYVCRRSYGSLSRTPKILHSQILYFSSPSYACLFFLCCRVKMQSDDEPRIVMERRGGDSGAAESHETCSADKYAGTRNSGRFLECGCGGDVLAQIRCCHNGSSRCWRYSRAKVLFRR